MRLHNLYSENRLRIHDTAARFSLRYALRLGLASSLLTLALLAGERAEGQSEPVSIASAGLNVSAPLTATASDAEHATERSTEQAQAHSSSLFNIFGSVSADRMLPPQSPGEKLSRGLLDSVSPSVFVFTAAEAGISQSGNKYPAFRQGAAGFGRYYWHDFTDQASQKLLVESLLPAVFHDDNRYYRLGHGGFFHRSGYALSRLVVTRSDAGQNTVNLPEIIGTGAAAGIANSYYPHRYNNWTETGQRWAFNAALDGGLMVVREFWPEFGHAVLRTRH